MVLPPGGFITLSCLLALMNHVQSAWARRRGCAYVPPATLDCRHCLICRRVED